jgi:hypothetical protein
MRTSAVAVHSRDVSQTPPHSPTQPALSAYTAMWSDVQAAGQSSDYQSERLSSHLDGKALVTVAENMSVDKANGVIGRGEPVLNPSVISANATTVTIRDCMNDEHWLKYYAGTGKPVDSVPGGRRYVVATVTEGAGAWKVTSLDVRGEGTC